jgi:hypothetical protein
MCPMADEKAEERPIDDNEEERPIDDNCPIDDDSFD